TWAYNHRFDQEQLSRLQFEAEAGAVGGSHVNSLGAARDLMFLLEPVVNLLRSTGPRQKHFAPRGVFVGEDEMGRTTAPASVRNDGNLAGSSQHIDPTQLGQSTAP